MPAIHLNELLKQAERMPRKEQLRLAVRLGIVNLL